jgi:hypothetical protein
MQDTQVKKTHDKCLKFYFKKKVPMVFYFKNIHLMELVQHLTKMIVKSSQHD